MRYTDEAALFHQADVQARIRRAREGRKIGQDVVLWIGVTLAMHANGTGAAWPSLRTLSEATGKHVRTVRDALEVLADAGVIVRLRTMRGAQATYAFVDVTADDRAGMPAQSETPKPGKVCRDARTPSTGSVQASVQGSVQGSPQRREEKRTNGERSRTGRAAHAFEDDGNGTCLTCGLPQANRQHQNLTTP